MTFKDEFLDKFKRLLFKTSLQNIKSMKLKGFLTLIATIFAIILSSSTFWGIFSFEKEFYVQKPSLGTYINTEQDGEDTDMFKDYMELKHQILSVDIKSSFLDNLSQEISESCRQNFNHYTKALGQTKTPIWAAQMLDATGSWDSGILEGNFIFEGRFTLCTRVGKSEKQLMDHIHGSYCLAHWIQSFPSMGLQTRGQGICIPDTCSTEDAHILFRQVYAPYLTEDINIFINCVRDDKRWYSDNGALFTVIIFTMFGTLSFAATFYHANFMPESLSSINQGDGIHDSLRKAYTCTNEELLKEPTKYEYNRAMHDLVLALSLYETIPKITSTKQPPGTLSYINGIRVISMMGIVFGHSYQMATFNAWPATLDNVFTYLPWHTDVFYHKFYLQTLDLNVDTFFTISAFVMSVSLFKKFDKAGGNYSKTYWFFYFLSRYWRLVSSSALVMLVFMNLWHYMGTGPFMSETFRRADDCRRDWWLSLLFINNLFPERSYCMGWFWYVCVDFQLYCISPIFIYFIWRYKRLGLSITVGTIIVVLIWHFTALKRSFVHESSRAGIVEYVYIAPWFRFPQYGVGMLCGYIFYKNSRDFCPPKVYMLCGWLIFVPCYLVLSYVPYVFCELSNLCIVEVSIYTVIYYALRSTLWALCVCWLLFTCQTGYSGFLKSFFSWKFFMPISRVSYQVYLIHPILCFLNFHGSPRQRHFTDQDFILTTFGNLFLSFVFAIILQTMFIIPLMNITSILGNKVKTLVKHKSV